MAANPRHYGPISELEKRENYREYRWRATQEETLNWEAVVTKAFMPDTPPNLAIVAVVGEADSGLTIAEIVDRVQATSKQAVASMSRRQIRNCIYNLERSGFMKKHCGEGETAVWSLSDRVRPEARSFSFPVVAQFEIDRS